MKYIYIAIVLNILTPQAKWVAGGQSAGNNRPHVPQSGLIPLPPGPVHQNDDIAPWARSGSIEERLTTPDVL